MNVLLQACFTVFRQHPVYKHDDRLFHTDKQFLVKTFFPKTAFFFEIHISVYYIEFTTLYILNQGAKCTPFFLTSVRYGFTIIYQQQRHRFRSKIRDALLSALLNICYLLKMFPVAPVSTGYSQSWNNKNCDCKLAWGAFCLFFRQSCAYNGPERLSYLFLTTAKN